MGNQGLPESAGNSCSAFPICEECGGRTYGKPHCVDHGPIVKSVCPGCGCEIDPDVCGCGDMREGHRAWDAGHEFVPLGCSCLYSE